MKPGTIVRLIAMSDPYPIPPDTIGVVLGKDALGDYLVLWSNGRSLKLIPEVDKWDVITNESCSDTPDR